MKIFIGSKMKIYLVMRNQTIDGYYREDIVIEILDNEDKAKDFIKQYIERYYDHVTFTYDEKNNKWFEDDPNGDGDIFYIKEREVK